VYLSDAFLIWALFVHQRAAQNGSFGPSQSYYHNEKLALAWQTQLTRNDILIFNATIQE
jgi:hypothetical protein